MSLERRLLALACGLFFGALLVLLSPLKMALAVVAVVALTLVLRQPEWGLAGFAFVATLIPYTTVQLGVRITISEALLGVTWLGVFWRLATGEVAWPRGKTELRMLWLMLFSLLPFLAGQVSIQAEGSGPVNWLRWLLNLSTLFLAPLLLADDKRRDRLIVALLGGTLAMLLLSIAYFLKDRDANTFIPLLEKLHYAHPEAVKDIFSANYTRMASPWVHPNLTGGALALFLPLAFFYALAQGGWRRLLGFSVALLGAAGLLFSISRGAIVSLALALAWMAWKRAPYAGRIIGVALALGLALVLFYPPLQERLATTFSASNASTEVRMDEYRHFPEAMKRFPLGIGFKVDPPPPGSGLLGISNLWLNFIYKMGVPGMCLFILLTRAWWRETRPRGEVRALDSERAVWFGTLGGLLAALLTGLFDHYYSFTMVLIGLFWLMMSLNLQSARRLAARGDPALSGLAARDARLPWLRRAPT
nr:O-antigen ligase family protein [Chromobacterium sp. ASV5]